MNYFDIIVGIILLVAAYKGFKRGLVFELISIIGLVIAIYGAFKFSYMAESYLLANAKDIEKFIPLLSFVIVFLIILLVIILMGKIMEKMINFTGLGIFNKLAGVVFGVIKAALIVGILTGLLLRFEPSVKIINDKTKKNSVLYQPVMLLVQTCKPILQDIYFEFKDKIKPNNESEDVMA